METENEIVTAGTMWGSQGSLQGVAESIQTAWKSNMSDAYGVHYRSIVGD